MENLDIPQHVDLFARGYDAFGQSPKPFVGTEVNKQVQTIMEAGVPAKYITSGNSYATIVVADGAYQSDGFLSGIQGWRFLPNGTIEANAGYFRGDLTGANGIFSGELRAASGAIGGFVITPQELYGGIIKTGIYAGQVGSNGVIMDPSGIRGYSALFGQVFYLPTDGSAPVFTKGVIQDTSVYSPTIAGGNIIGTIITGGRIRTAFDGRRIEIDSSGIQAINGALGKTFGDSSAKFGDNTRFYGSGILVYINNNDYKIPFYVNQEQTVADVHLYNRSAAPTGKAEVGDLAVINNKLSICISAGTPGTFVVAGTQTA